MTLPRSGGERPAGPDRASGVLRLGSRVLPLDDVASCTAECISEPGRQGSPVTFAIYLAIAAGFIVLVFDIGWRTRFLLAAAMFAGIAVTAFADARRLVPLTYYRVRVGLRSGGEVEYTTVDEADELRFLELQRSIPTRTWRRR